MGFRGQVHDHVRAKLREQMAHLGGIAYIGMSKLISGIVSYRSNRLQIPRVSQFVNIKDAVIRIQDQVTDNCRADEARSAGD